MTACAAGARPGPWKCSITPTAGRRTLGTHSTRTRTSTDSRTAVVSVPTLIFQGQRDDLVDPRMVEAFAAARPNVTLRLFDDDHRLQASLGPIVRETAAFCGLSGLA